MDASTFRTPAAGRVVRAPQGYHAFVPAPLPPELHYTPALVRLLSVADAALSELSGLGRILPNPHLLIAPYLRARYVTLGTDGFGRSDTRTALRQFFEVDRRSIVIAALHAIVEEGGIEGKDLKDAVGRYGVATDRSASWIQ